MICLRLFWSFFLVGLFSFGGGYAALPLIQYQVVELNRWLTLDQLTDVFAISQITAGPIALHTAALVGTQTAGLPGAVAATLGCVFPACALVLILARFYDQYPTLTVIQGVSRGLRPAAAALLTLSGLSMLPGVLLVTGDILGGVDFVAAVLFPAALVVLRRWKPHPIWVMAGCGGLGLLVYTLV